MNNPMYLKLRLLRSQVCHRAPVSGLEVCIVEESLFLVKQIIRVFNTKSKAWDFYRSLQQQECGLDIKRPGIKIIYLRAIRISFIFSTASMEYMCLGLSKVKIPLDNSFLVIFSILWNDIRKLNKYVAFVLRWRLEAIKPSIWCYYQKASVPAGFENLALWLSDLAFGSAHLSTKTHVIFSCWTGLFCILFLECRCQH